MSIQKILLKLNIVQVADNELRREQGLKRLGKCYFKAYRLNSYNPFSYIIIFVWLIYMLIGFGVMGVIQNINNPFKWD